MRRTRVAINGFGRIGRLVLRAAIESNRKDFEFVAINDLGSPEMNAHLLMHDSVHGRLNCEIEASKDRIRASSFDMVVCGEMLPSRLPWRDLEIDIVMECTGRFNERIDAASHLSAGAKRVLISAPSKGADKTVVFGVNDDTIKSQDAIVSNASCTTNCLAPVAKVLHECIGIERGFMTTVHSFTGDQRAVDTLHKDFYRARAASSNLIPTTTGAAKAVGLVLPALEGKLDGTAIRVPTPNVSLIDFKFNSRRATSVAEINNAMKAAAISSRLRSVLQVNAEPLVSSDFNHNAASAVFDLDSTEVVDGSLCRVMAWYDNEWGFSNRMLDTAAVMAKLL
jgi:glyceraldehyde 3-phosphate dehydrogenase